VMLKSELHTLDEPEPSCEADIARAYRKAALRHHPDKQRARGGGGRGGGAAGDVDDAERTAATDRFVVGFLVAQGLELIAWGSGSEALASWILYATAR
jgi:hypothetical protein